MTTLSGALVVVGFCVHVVLSGSLLAALGSEHLGAGGVTPVPVRMLYLLAVITGAWFVLPKAWFSLRRLRPDMNLLMTVAVIGAVALGQWFEAGTVSFLFALSLAMESWSVGRARRAVEALMKIAPESVGVLEFDGTIRDELSASIPVGTLFRVRPGERNRNRHHPETLIGMPRNTHSRPPELLPIQSQASDRWARNGSLENRTPWGTAADLHAEDRERLVAFPWFSEKVPLTIPGWGIPRGGAVHPARARRPEDLA